MVDTDFPSATTLLQARRSSAEECYLACLTTEGCGAAIFYHLYKSCQLKGEPLGSTQSVDGSTALMPGCNDYGKFENSIKDFQHHHNRSPNP